MSRLVLIVVEDQWREMWIRRVGGLTVLGRAILALSDAGASVGVIGGGDLALRAMAGRSPKNDVRSFTVGTSADEAARSFGISSPALALYEPFICDRATARRLAQGAQDAPRPLEYEIEARIAEETLLAGTRKTIAADGIVSVLVFRPLSRAITRMLIDTPVTPNQVTIVAMLFGVLAGVLAASGSYSANILAALLLGAGGVADCVDGELARLRLQGSRLGEWLDSLADDISTGCFLVGLAFGQNWMPFGIDPLSFGLGVAAIFLVMSIYMYHALNKYIGVLDTAQFPYFFMRSRTAPVAENTIGFADMIGLIFKRDFLIALSLLFAVWNAPWLSLLMLGIGVCITAIAVLLTAIIRPPHRFPKVSRT